MKTTTKPKRILNIVFQGTFNLKMTENMEKLYDDFWTKEESFYEDEECTEEEYDMAREKLEEAIESEVRKLCPYLEDFDIDDFEEREN